MKSVSFLKMLISELMSIRSYHTRKCKSLSDLNLIINGVLRVCKKISSGRDFLQYIDDYGIDRIHRTTFFDALSSKRRQLVVRDYSKQFYERLSKKISSLKIDYLQQFSELGGFTVVSGDGHFIEHSCHGKRHPTKNKVYPVGNIYIQNLRTGLIYPHCTITDGSNKNHEMPLFRKAANFTPNTICVLDRAYIDNNFWSLQRHNCNVYFISRKKYNQVPENCGNLCFEQNDPINEGVLSDKLIGFSTGQTMMRLIKYEDPETREQFEFVTSMTASFFRPGLICHLYFLRWQIEKCYDLFKNRFGEVKAWGSSSTSVEIHSHFIAMYYNFLRLLEAVFTTETQTADVKCQEKYKKSIKKRDEKARQDGRFVRSLLKLPVRLSQLSFQFIRLVKNLFEKILPLTHLQALYRQRMLAYL